MFQTKSNNANRSRSSTNGLAKVNKCITHALHTLGSKKLSKSSPLPSLPSLEFIQYNDTCSPDPPPPTWRDPAYRTLRNGTQVKILHTFKRDGLMSEQESMRDIWTSRGDILLGPAACPSQKLGDIRMTKEAVLERRRREKENRPIEFYVNRSQKLTLKQQAGEEKVTVMLMDCNYVPERRY